MVQGTKLRNNKVNMEEEEWRMEEWWDKKQMFSSSFILPDPPFSTPCSFRNKQKRRSTIDSIHSILITNRKVEREEEQPQVQKQTMMWPKRRSEEFFSLLEIQCYFSQVYWSLICGFTLRKETNFVYFLYIIQNSRWWLEADHDLLWYEEVKKPGFWNNLFWKVNYWQKCSLF